MLYSRAPYRRRGGGPYLVWKVPCWRPGRMSHRNHCHKSEQPKPFLHGWGFLGFVSLGSAPHYLDHPKTTPLCLSHFVFQSVGKDFSLFLSFFWLACQIPLHNKFELSPKNLKYTSPIPYHPQLPLCDTRRVSMRIPPPRARTRVSFTYSKKPSACRLSPYHLSFSVCRQKCLQGKKSALLAPLPPTDLWREEGRGRAEGNSFWVGSLVFDGSCWHGAVWWYTRNSKLSNSSF